MPDLFKDWVATINEKDRNLYKGANDQILDAEYPSFMINRAFSQSADTIMQANMMNMKADFLKPEMQYAFLMLTVPKRKRFEKWAKPESIERINVIMKTFDYSKQKAEAISPILTDEQIEQMKAYSSEGGMKNG